MTSVAPSADTRDEIDEFLRTVDRSRIRTVFQPIVDLRHGATAAFELLSRPAGLEVTADDLFERAREICAGPRLELACADAAADAIRALPELMRSRHTFFLNFSAETIVDCGANLERLRFCCGNIVIEITERTAAGDLDRFAASVAHYVQRGFQFALDDFGSGHSDLVTLIASKPQYVKLDRAVIRDAGSDPFKQTIVRSIAALARDVGAVLIAEGVERWSEAETLIRCGIEWAQGFLFGRPVPRPGALPRGVSRGIVRASYGSNRIRPADCTINE